MNRVIKVSRDWTPKLLATPDDPDGTGAWWILLDTLKLPVQTSKIRCHVTLTPTEYLGTQPKPDEKPTEPIPEPGGD